MTYADDVYHWFDSTGHAEASLNMRLNVMTEELEEFHKGVQAGDLIEIADGAADSIWTILGVCHFYNIPFDLVWAEVSMSNYGKIMSDGSVIRREDGKIQKPNGWTPPNIAGVINQKPAVKVTVNEIPRKETT